MSEIEKIFNVMKDNKKKMTILKLYILYILSDNRKSSIKISDNDIFEVYFIILMESVLTYYYEYLDININKKLYIKNCIIDNVHIDVANFENSFSGYSVSFDIDNYLVGGNKFKNLYMELKKL